MGFIAIPLDIHYHLLANLVLCVVVRRLNNNGCGGVQIFDLANDTHARFPQISDLVETTAIRPPHA